VKYILADNAIISYCGYTQVCQLKDRQLMQKHLKCCFQYW